MTGYFTVTHESGRTWRLFSNDRRGVAFMNSSANNKARNLCKRNRLTGSVVMENESTGNKHTIVINSDYSI